MGVESMKGSTCPGTNESDQVTPFFMDETIGGGVFNDQTEVDADKHKYGARKHYSSLREVKVSNFAFSDALEEMEELDLRMPYLAG